MRRRPPTTLTVILALAALAAGCVGKPPTVSGDVTLDGAPLDEGLITFVPDDQKAPRVAVPVKDGKYTASVPAGPCRVEITAPKATGEKKRMYPTPDSPLVDVIVERIPERYNVKSELKGDVKAGANTLNWPLKSK